MNGEEDRKNGLISINDGNRKCVGAKQVKDVEIGKAASVNVQGVNDRWA